MKSIIYARHNILPELIDLIREHGYKDWDSKTCCECCGENIHETSENIYKKFSKEGIITTSIGCFCADCIEEFLEYIFK